jgi:hypothetical protein
MPFSAAALPSENICEQILMLGIVMFMIIKSDLLCPNSLIPVSLLSSKDAPSYHNSPRSEIEFMMMKEAKRHINLL